MYSKSSDAYFEEAFRDTRILGIVRGSSPGEAVSQCRRAWDLGLSVVEVSVSGRDGLQALTSAIAEGKRTGHSVGAGTITSVALLQEVHELGAAFSVAPGTNADVLSAASCQDLPHLPGVASASDITQALNRGFSWLKVFPAAWLGADWIRLIRGPFPEVRFIATGGMNAENAQTFLDAGCTAVAIGSALNDESQRSLLAPLALHKGRQV